MVLFLDKHQISRLADREPVIVDAHYLGAAVGDQVDDIFDLVIPPEVVPIADEVGTMQHFGPVERSPAVLDAVVAADHAHAGRTKLLDRRGRPTTARAVAHDGDVEVEQLLDEAVEPGRLDATERERMADRDPSLPPERAGALDDQVETERAQFARFGL